MLEFFYEHGYKIFKTTTFDNEDKSDAGVEYSLLYMKELQCERLQIPGQTAGSIIDVE